MSESEIWTIRSGSRQSGDGGLPTAVCRLPSSGFDPVSVDVRACCHCRAFPDDRQGFDSRAPAPIRAPAPTMLSRDHRLAPTLDPRQQHRPIEHGDGAIEHSAPTTVHSMRHPSDRRPGRRCCADRSFLHRRVAVEHRVLDARRPDRAGRRASRPTSTPRRSRRAPDKQQSCRVASRSTLLPSRRMLDSPSDRSRRMSRSPPGIARASRCRASSPPAQA